jgi:AbiV family abortive infection protein
MQRLSASQMAEIALEAMRNARRLLDDAAALARDKRLASAFMLAVLAADELGKHILVTSFYSREGTEDDWRKFWRRFRNHTEKLGDALLSAWIGDLLADEPLPDVGEFPRQRLAATYVDVSDTGTVEIPSGAVSSKAFEATFNSIDRELRFCEKMLANATPESLRKVFESMRASPRGSALAKCCEKFGAEAGTAFAISLRSGMNLDEAMTFAQNAGEIFAGLRQDSDVAEDD